MQQRVSALERAIDELRTRMGHLDDCQLANQRAFSELRGSLSELRGACVAAGQSALDEVRTKMGHLDDCLLANQRAFSELCGSLSELRDAREATAQSALDGVRTQISRLEGFQADNQRALSELRVGVSGLELLTSEHGLRGSDNAASALRELSLARSQSPRGRSRGPDEATVAHDTQVALAQTAAAQARGYSPAASTRAVLNEYLGRRAAGDARCGSLPPHLVTRRG